MTSEFTCLNCGKKDSAIWCSGCLAEKQFWPTLKAKLKDRGLSQVVLDLIENEVNELIEKELI
jgi:hypothetical protein